MKELIYKELKLSLHPVCYIFVLVFPFMIFIPKYPLCISFIYICACYPVLFLGVNKGVQTNDLLFTVLLPVRKKDIVLSRLITCSLMQFVSNVISFALLPFAKKVLSSIDMSKANLQGAHLDLPSGFEFSEFIFVSAFVLLSFCVYDFLFFHIYCRSAKSIVMSTLLSMFVFIILILTTTIILPLTSDGYSHFFKSMNGFLRLIFFALVLLIYFISHYFIYRHSSKQLEKIDF